MSKTFALHIYHHNDKRFIDLSGYENLDSRNTLYVIAVVDDANFNSGGLVKSRLRNMIQLCDPSGTDLNPGIEFTPNMLKLFKSLNTLFLSGIRIITNPYNDTELSFIYSTGTLHEGKFIDGENFMPASLE